ncbi:MAG: phosphatidate cytidylyltransferase [Clostridia bacterium]|nr:phosphatidate cytidylyltransferase [Clostridia bacterium]MDE7328652.1 phosphatidate cytidylyltransferase [Clostridia bacterium]
MLKRILTAIVMLAVVFGTILGLRQLYVEIADVVAMLVCWIGVYEMAQAFKKSEYNAIKGSLISGSILMYPLILFFDKTIGRGELGLLIAILVALAVAISEFTLIHKFELKDLLATVFILIYPLATFSTLILINHSAYGLMGIFLALLIPIMTDTMAYFVGVTFKGKKLCPNISPKKTISGAIGGLIGGIIGAMLVFVLFDVCSVFVNFAHVGYMSITKSLGASAAIYVIVGLIGGILSELGDLGASWIKRKAGIKDFGKIFPGHGGIMDRLDSIIFVLPLVLLLISVVSAVNAL